MITRRYTIRLDPTPSQIALLWQYAGTRRFIWNWALDKIIKGHAAGEKLDWGQLNREFGELRQSTDWLRALNSHTARAVIYCDLKKAMQAFFRRVKKGEKPGFPRFKSRSDTGQGFIIPEGCYIANRRLVAIRQRFKLMRDIPGSGELGGAVRIKIVAGKWYASFTMNSEVGVPNPVEPKNLVGIDIGLSKYAVISDGTVIENPRWTRKFERKLAHAQRKLARQKKGSNRRKKQKQRIAKIHAGIANRRRHFSHLVSRQIANNYDAVCIETHSIENQKHLLGKAVSDVGQGHFRQCLAYKLPDLGKQLLLADKYFPSSKLCSTCGYKMLELPLSIRKWTCPSCGEVHDRDFNAAINLQHEGRQQVIAALMSTT
jgi:putative transposase